MGIFGAVWVGGLHRLGEVVENRQSGLPLYGFQEGMAVDHSVTKDAGIL